jgi:hypothetical protein
LSASTRQTFFACGSRVSWASSSLTFYSTKEREQHKETLAAASRRAFLSFQADVSECHALVVVSRQLAVIDCLMSLAQVAAASGYCKPQLTAEPELHIRDGRHPMVRPARPTILQLWVDLTRLFRSRCFAIRRMCPLISTSQKGTVGPRSLPAPIWLVR